MRNAMRLCLCAVLLLGFSASAFASADLAIETYVYHAGPIGHDAQSFTAPDKVAGSNFPSCPGGWCGRW